MKKRIFILLVAILGIVGGARAQSFTMDAPKVVEPGEIFHVAFTLLNAECESFTPPTITGAEDLMGGRPAQAYGSHLDLNTKVKTSKTTFTYTLKAVGGGSITISPASVKTHKGRTLSTRAAKIQVVSGGRAVPGSTSESVTASTVFLKMETNKRSVYKGEAIVATLKIYTQVGVAGFSDAKLPAFNGFWKQELDLGEIRPERVNIGERVYEALALQQWLIYPQKSGTVEIEQTDISAQVLINERARSTSHFETFFGRMRVPTVTRKLTAPAVKINVKELPQPAPEDFTGGVGRFELEVGSTVNQISANSGGSLMIKLEGVGDFPLIEEPYVEFPMGFDKFNSKSSESLQYTAEGSAGTRLWEMPFIARAEGDFTLPTVTMSYFDTSLGKYVQLKGDEIKVKVTKDVSSGSIVGGMVSGVTKEDLQIINEDVHYIRTGVLKLTSRDKSLLWSPTFFALLAVIIASFGTALVLMKARIKNRADVVRMKNKKANSVAIKRLRKAKDYMASNDKGRFYEEMLRALWGYMGDKMAIAAADLNKERLREEFERRDVSPEHGQEFLELIAECELAQYSPLDTVDMDKVYNSALDLIGKLELK